MNNPYFELMKLWCDRLLDFQVKGMGDDRLDGGLLCPACTRMHGRSADVIYPLLTVAEYTGDSKYIEAAKALYQWTELNFKLPNGGYTNDRDSFWFGISAFYQVSLCEALLYHGHLLDAETVAQWKKSIQDVTDFLVEHIYNSKPVVNYRAGMAASMALAAKVLEEPKYLEKSREYAEEIYTYICEDFLYGEAKPLDTISPKGCRSIDLGYNMEETLGSLALYVKHTGDGKMKQCLLRLLHHHLKFMMPDGAIDNSFGVRSAKWTYYGSRTSDGCQIGYGAFGDEDPILAEAAHRNFELLKACTVDGLLCGGPMHEEAGEPACLHHSFCHAKALAFLVDNHFEYKEPAKLPCEAGDAVEFYKPLHVYKIRKGGWHASITGYDHPGQCCSGGAMTLLWHEKCGPIFAASNPKYVLVEPSNMQISRSSLVLCQTPHIAYNQGEEVGTTPLFKQEARFNNLYDLSAEITRDGDSFAVTGSLRDAGGNPAAAFHLGYEFTEDQITITASCDAEDASYRMPVIASSREEIQLTENSLEVRGKGFVKRVTANVPIRAEQARDKRNFNPTGGFQAFIISAAMDAGKPVTFTISVHE